MRVRMRYNNSTKPFSKRKPSSKAHMKAYRQRPEVKEKLRERSRLYSQRPEVKARRKEQARLRKMTPEQRVQELIKQLKENYHGTKH